MTPQEQIEYLATKVMGWQIVRCARKDHAQTEEYSFCSGWEPEMDGVSGCYHNVPFSTGFRLHYRSGDWNPLTDWNHWRQVEVEAVRDHTLWHNFMHLLGINTTGTGVPSDCSKMYVRSPLGNRVSALISAHQELYK